MDPALVELTARRLLAGRTRLRVRAAGGRPRTFYHQEPNAPARARAAEAFALALARARRAGLPTAEEAVADLRARGLWSGADEDELKKVAKDLDALRAGVWEARARPGPREAVRRSLRAAEARHAALSARRHRTYAATADAFAAAARTRALVAAGLRRADGETPVWPGGRCGADRNGLAEAAAAALAAARPPEAVVRAVARGDLWRAASAGGPWAPFGVPPGDWGDDQRALAAWGRLYEAAREDPEGPAEFLDDDDVVDGWAAARRAASRKPEKQVAASEKIRNAAEVFVVVDEADPHWNGVTAAEVGRMNGPMERAVQEKIFRRAERGEG